MVSAPINLRARAKLQKCQVRSIYNSGQVWKFKDMAKLKKIIDGMDENGWKDTNLIFINGYFTTQAYDDIELIPLNKWFNCNTVTDYRISR